MSAKLLPAHLSSLRHSLVFRAFLVVAILAAGVWGAWQIRRYLKAESSLRAGEESLRQHEYRDALGWFEKSLEVHPDSPTTLLLAAEAARRAADYDAFAQFLKAYRRAGGLPEAADFEQTLARIQRGEAEPKEADFFHAAQNGHPDAPMILEALTRGCLSNYRLGFALNYLNYWLDKEPDSVQAHLWRADCYERMLRHEVALEDYRCAFQLAPDRLDIRRELAHALVEARQPVEALQHLAVLCEAHPKDPTILLWLARCHHMSGETPAAQSVLEELLADHPDDAGALRERGKLALEDNKPEKAEVWLRKAVEHSPADRDALLMLIQALSQDGKEAEAQDCQAKLQRLDAQLSRVADLSRAIGESPHNPALRHEMALIFLSKGETREGIRWLQSALKEDPLYQPALKALAEQAKKERPESVGAPPNGQG
jgi:tetratricopeptide (TPR) repeat protein